MNLDLDRSSPLYIKKQSEFTGKLFSSSKPYFVEMGHGVGDKRESKKESESEGVRMQYNERVNG